MQVDAATVTIIIILVCDVLGQSACETILSVNIITKL